MAALTIIRDRFEGEAARAKMAYVVFAVNIVPMVAPTVGAALLALDGWRTIYLMPIAAGCLLLVAMWGFTETARIDPYTVFDTTNGPITSAEQEHMLLENLHDFRIVHLPTRYHMVHHIAPAACATALLHFMAAHDGIACHEA